jgi:peptidoglycan/xylan/chitin deacetylase (PgdA/CDA1 family)
MGRRVNICFHGIGAPRRELEPGEDSYWLDIASFEEIIDYLKSRPDSVGMSFDDGNESDVAIALPALRRHKLTATFFPIAGRIEKCGSVDRSSLRELARAGMTIGSHGMHHSQWRKLPRSRMEEEFVDARRLIEDISQAAIATAACPLGAYDRRSLSRLRRLGYTHVFTSDRCTAKSSAWLQPRFSLRRTDSLTDIRRMVEQPERLGARALSLGRVGVKRLR